MRCQHCQQISQPDEAFHFCEPLHDVVRSRDGARAGLLKKQFELVKTLHRLSFGECKPVKGREIGEALNKCETLVNKNIRRVRPKLNLIGLDIHTSQRIPASHALIFYEAA